MSLDIGMGAGGSTSLPGGSPGEPVVLGDGTVVVPTVTGGQTFVLTLLHPDGSKVEQLVTLPNLGVYQLGWAYRAIPNGRDGFLVQLMAMRHDSHTYSGPGLGALVVGVDSAGNYTGHAEVGNAWGEGDIVVLGDKAIATGYVWYQSGNSWNRTHLGWVTELTLDGNQAGIATIYQPSGICPNWPARCAFTPEETISVTSLVAVGGGGVIMGLSNGNGGGAGPAFEGMGLTHLQPEEDGTYLGAGPAGLAQFGVVEAATPLATVPSSLFHWSYQGGNPQRGSAQQQVPPCLTYMKTARAAKKAGAGAGIIHYTYARGVGVRPNEPIDEALATAINSWNSLSSVSGVQLDPFPGDASSPPECASSGSCATMRNEKTIDFVIRKAFAIVTTCASSFPAKGEIHWEPGLQDLTPAQMASAFMHEIGHLLLLADSGTDKNPNSVPTIMIQGAYKTPCTAGFPTRIPTSVQHDDARAVAQCIANVRKK
jgi:hypothetical protein